RHPGKPGVLPEHGTAPTAHGHHDELAADGVLLVEIGRQLADRHAVTDGQGIQPDERLECRIGHVALEYRATEGVGPIEYDDANTEARADAHGERHSPDERVVA